MTCLNLYTTDVLLTQDYLIRTFNQSETILKISYSIRIFLELYNISEKKQTNKQLFQECNFFMNKTNTHHYSYIGH